ncbi:MAG: AI-2E family transporter [Chloroflexota bacterium]
MQTLTTEKIIFVIPVFNTELDVSKYIYQLNKDFLALSEQVLLIVQPLLGQAGGLLATIASSALSGLGWGAFIFIISYFILAEAGEVPNFLKGVSIPGHMNDLERIGRRLGRIWNAFMRGQLLLFVMIIVSSFFLLTLLGVRNAMGLAFLAGLAKFIPYVGPLIAGITTALVAFFQGGNYLGIETLNYAVIVIVLSILLDQIFDNIVAPRMFGQTLGVHPAAVLISAIVLANLIGFIGLLLAAPVLASLQLFIQYAIRKMVDLNPWPEPEIKDKKTKNSFSIWLKSQWQKITSRKKRKKNDDETG